MQFSIYQTFISMIFPCSKYVNLIKWQLPIYSHFISGQNRLSFCSLVSMSSVKKKNFFLCLNFIVPNNWQDENFYFYSVWLCRNPVIVYICGWKYIYFYIAVFSNCVENNSLLKTTQYVLFGSSRRKKYIIDFGSNSHIYQ